MSLFLIIDVNDFRCCAKGGYKWATNDARKENTGYYLKCYADVQLVTKIMF